MDSIVIGILVAVIVWLFMRQRRALEQKRRRARDPSSTEAPKTFPRIGTQGSVTKEQLARLKALHFEPSPLWSREEAALILDSVAYLRAAILQVTGDADPPEEIQNQVLAFILSDDKLREYMISWGQGLRDEGSERPGSLAQNEHFDRVAAFLTSRSGEKQAEK